MFLKELKQRFTQWYNRRKNRRGTLWEDRFKSVLVFGHGEERSADEVSGQVARRGFQSERAEAEFKRGGKLSIPEILRCKVRYFSDGAIFGSVEFVNEVFEANRSRYGPNRKTGARKMRGADWGNLRTLRDLKKRPVLQ